MRIMGGFFVMLSLALGVPESPFFVSPWFLAFTAFVGFNLFQSGFTNFCPPVTLHRLHKERKARKLAKKLGTSSHN